MNKQQASDLSRCIRDRMAELVRLNVTDVYRDELALLHRRLVYEELRGVLTSAYIASPSYEEALVALNK